MMIPGITSYLPRVDGDSGQQTQGRVGPRASRNVADPGSAASEARRAGSAKARGAGSSAKTPEMPERLAQAAEEFEALLVAQMLKTFRESGSGGWLGSDDGKGNPAMELAETQLAKTLAQGGALGIKEQLARNLAKAPVRNATPGAGNSATEGGQARTRLNSASDGS